MDTTIDLASAIQATHRRGWSGVAALTPGAFALTVTEFIPLGLVPLVSQHLHVSLGRAGLMVLVPGLIAALAAPVIVVATGRVPRKLLVLALSLSLLVSNLLAMLAPSFALLLVARAVAGLALGGFWAIVPVLAAQLAPAERRARATSFVIAGAAVGTVVGLPAGQLIGELLGWRAAFGSVALLSALVLLAQVVLVPTVPPREGLPLSAFKDVLRSRSARIALSITAPVIIAQFAAATFVAPLLTDVVGLSDAQTTALLLAYSCASILGTLIGGALVSRTIVGTMVGAATVLGSAVICTSFLVATTPLVVLMVVLWGLAWGTVPVVLQTWAMSSVPDAPEAASAALVTVFQLAIAGGALIGGVVVDASGLRRDFAVAGALAIAGGAYGLVRRRSVAA